MNTKSIDRRRFLVIGSSALAVAAAIAAPRARAQAAKLDEKDPQAAGLGYRHDTTKVDGAKFPNHSAQQQCSNCALYQGKASDALGGCPIFAGRQVAAKGWCSAWAKKA
jgi:hypothetical protein